MSITKTFEQASKDLLMMSESDYPFEVLIWQMQSDRQMQSELLQHFNYPKDTQVETESIDDFFSQACSEQEWQTQTEKQTAKKFQSLVATLKRELNQLQVFRLHKTPTNIEVYILGQTNTGEVAGLKTELVET